MAYKIIIDHSNTELSRGVFFVWGKIPNPPKQPTYIKIHRSDNFKARKKSFLVTYLNKKCYFINFSLALKLWELLKK